MRDFQNKEKISNLLGFDTVVAYNQWANQFENKSLWEKFYTEWLQPQRQKKPETGNRKRDAQLEEVRREVAYGESEGKRTYSRDEKYLQTTRWDGKNWLAWLLFNLVTSNTAGKDGIFFGKNMPLEEREQKIWQHIQREMWKSSNARKTRSMTASSSQVAEDVLPQRVPDLPRPPTPEVKSTVGGKAKVYWETLSEEIEEQGFKSQIYIDKLNSYDWPGFIRIINEKFDFKRAKLQVNTICMSNGERDSIPPAADDSYFTEVTASTFDELCSYAVRLERSLILQMRTTKMIESLVHDDGLNPEGAALDALDEKERMLAEMEDDPHGRKQEDHF